MKKLLFSLTAAIALLAAAPAFAGSHDFNDAPSQGRPDSYDNNYGFDRNHKVTPQERKRWEEQHKHDRKDDRRKDHKDDHRDDHNNYGFDKKHKVTPQERARWEAQHKNDHR